MNVGKPLKQGVFPSMIITYALIRMVGKNSDENGMVDVITNSSCDGVDYERWSVFGECVKFCKKKGQNPTTVG